MLNKAISFSNSRASRALASPIVGASFITTLIKAPIKALIKPPIKALVMALVISFALPAYAEEHVQLEELRSIFVSAEKNLKANKLTAYKQDKAKLRGYPLIAYLDYQEMLKEGNNPRKIEAFLKSYPNFPYKRSLRKNLLDDYYKKRSWRKIADMEPARDDICLHLLSLHKLKRDQEYVLTRIKELWLAGHYFNEKCDALIKSMKLRLYTNNDILWDRIDGAAQNRNWRTIRATSKYIPRSQSGAYNAMNNLRRGSRYHLKRELPNMKNTKPYRVALTYGLTRYPSDHILEAYDLYTKQIADDFSFDADQKKRIEYHLGLFLTIENNRLGFEVMQGIDPSLLIEEEHEWRARSAIKFGKWKELGLFIDDFPSDLQQKSDWLYWKGYSLVKLGKNREARKVFQEAAEDRSFYGFLAAERLGEPLNIKQTYTSHREGSTVLSQPSFQRFFEFDALDRTRQALSEWEATLRLANQDELLYLANAAYAKGWYFHAIRAFAVAGYWDDLHRRFPTPYLEQVKTAAKVNRLDPALVYAIIRTESSFRADIVSRAGAVGLMQLLPSTGRSMMRRVNYKGSRRLTNPQTSVDIGSAYIRRLLNDSKGNLVISIASYNAGPNAVKQWLPQNGNVPAVEWLETIPYGETRKYVRSILYAQTIFAWRLGDEKPSLSNKLQSVKKT